MVSGIMENYIMNHALKGMITGRSNSVFEAQENALEVIRNSSAMYTRLKSKYGFKTIEPSDIRGICAEVMLDILLQEYIKTRRGIGVASNLLINRNDNKYTTQIDSIFITSGGIIVIEAKSLYGRLTIEDSMIKRVKNAPLRPWDQNEMHISCLRDFLEKGIGGFNRNTTPIINAVYLFSDYSIESYKPVPREFLITNKNFEKFFDTMLNLFKENKNKINAEKVYKDLLNKSYSTVNKDKKHVDNILKRR